MLQQSPVLRYLSYCSWTKLTADQRSMATHPPYHPALSTPLKELSLVQILISTMYSKLPSATLDFFSWF